MNEITPHLWFDTDGPGETSQRVMVAMPKMKKIDIAELERAAAQT
jgi:hypothetical protein